MSEAMRAIGDTGKLPEEAAAILFYALARGTLIGRADHLRVEFTDGVTEYRDHVVPAGMLELGPIPPLGHPFWSEGDVRVHPDTLREGSAVYLDGQSFVAPFGGLLPVFTIRGLRVPRDGVLAICRPLMASAHTGRRKGIGGYAKHDEALVREMHRLVTEGSAASVRAAAVAVAAEAKGRSLFESKVRRLVDRYRAAAR
jgi:hypothetical protein